MGVFKMKKRSHKCESIKEEDEQSQEAQQPKDVGQQTPEQAAISTQISTLEKQIADLEKDTATKKSALENQLVQLREKYRAAGGQI